MTTAFDADPDLAKARVSALAGSVDCISENLVRRSVPRGACRRRLYTTDCIRCG